MKVMRCEGKITECERCEKLTRESEFTAHTDRVACVEIDGQFYVLCSKCRKLTTEELWKWGDEQK